MRGVITCLQREIVRLTEMKNSSGQNHILELNEDVTKLIEDMKLAIIHLRTKPKTNTTDENDLKNVEFLVNTIIAWNNQHTRSSYHIQAKQELIEELNKHFKFIRR